MFLCRAKMLPSHTVGLEQERRVGSLMESSCHHPTQWAWNIEYYKITEDAYLVSLSHTVGLERILGGPQGDQTLKSVSIPPSGLGT